MCFVLLFTYQHVTRHAEVAPHQKFVCKQPSVTVIGNAGQITLDRV